MITNTPYFKLNYNTILLDKKHAILDTKSIIIQANVKDVSEYFGESERAIKYVAYHIDESGNIFNFPKYNVVEDNRKKYNE